MNCPACGSQITSNQKFCRSCGGGLEPAGRGAIGLRNRMARSGFIAMFAGLMIAVTGAILLHLDVVIFIGVMATIAGMFLVGYSSMMPARPKNKARPSTQSETLEKAETTKKLPPMTDIDFVPSVTERTTSLLETPVATATKPR